MVFFLMIVTVLSPVSEIHDQPDTGNDRKVVVVPLVLDQLQVRCQVGPRGDLEVVVELEAI
jgi:hypothetical protein